MLTADGVENFNRMDFTHCRAYSAQSAIRYDVGAGEEEPPAGAQSATAPVHAIAPFLTVPMALTTPVTEKDSVGALIEARVTEDVLHKGAVVLSKGSVVRGRIRRLERYRGGARFIVGLEFVEVEVRGQAMPFYADLLRTEKNPRIQAALKEKVLVRRASGVRAADVSITLAEWRPFL